MLDGLACEFDPAGAWAAHAVFSRRPAHCRNRAPIASSLDEFKDGMRAFLAKPRSVPEIQKAEWKGNTFRAEATQ